MADRKYLAGDVVTVRGVVAYDDGDAHTIAVRLTYYGAVLYPPRDQVEFVHSSFKVGDPVVYSHLVLGKCPGRVVAISGNQAWITIDGSRGDDVIAEFAELAHPEMDPGRYSDGDAEPVDLNATEMPVPPQPRKFATIGGVLHAMPDDYEAPPAETP